MTIGDIPSSRLNMLFYHKIIEMRLNSYVECGYLLLEDSIQRDAEKTRHNEAGPRRTFRVWGRFNTGHGFIRAVSSF